jgi:superfamily II DNA or RNA helicase
MTWRSGDRVIVRGTAWRVTRSTPFTDCEALDLSAELSTVTRTLLLPFDRPRRASSVPPKVVSRRRWAHRVSALVRASHPYGGLRCCPPAIRLLPYQLEPALAVLRHGVLRLLVADDVGLGKTVEAALIVREVALASHLSRVLIVCPAGLRGQWAQELDSLFELQVVGADAGWLRKRMVELPPDVNPWSVPGVYLTSMDFVKRPEALRPLEDVRWDLLVIDEAHAATPASDRRAALDALGHRARRLVLLTATPHSGDEDQFSALCTLGRGLSSPDLVVFHRTRSDTQSGGTRVKSTVLAVGLTDAERRMHRLLEDYTSRVWTESTQRKDAAGELLATVLRKRALSSAISLARSVRRRLLLLTATVPAPAQMSLPWNDDDAIEDETADSVLRAPGLTDEAGERQALSAIAAAADIVGKDESKTRALLRLLRRVCEPALVFSEYRDTADWLCRVIADAGHHVRLLHGGLTPSERHLAAAAFNAGGLILVATDAASEGLNLHRSCRLVVHFELPWTPSRMHQRGGRVNRIGQSKRVHEIALVGDHTAEQLVLAPLLRRAHQASAYSRPTLLNQLTESRVAGHILAGVPLDRRLPETRSPMRIITMDLVEEARLEADRLQQLRRVDFGARRRGPARRPLDLAIARLPRRGLRRGDSLTIVFVVALREPNGETVDQCLVPLSFEIPAVEWRRSASLLRHQVERALQDLDPAIRGLLDERIRSRLARLLPIRADALAALRARDADMARELQSTARQLVQAGLFDRRGLRASASRAQVRDVLDDERSLAVAGTSPGDRLEGTWRAHAILVGGQL